jgi:type IX secretion system PorP/SprF family membrane protein
MIDGRFKKNHGVGLNLNLYQAGLINDFSAKATYAYHVQLNKTSFLSAGIAAGITQQKFRLSEVVASDYSDDLLIQGNQSDMGFTSDAGILFYNKKLRVGVAIPQVFAKGIGVAYAEGEKEYKLVNHLVASAALDVVRNDQWQLTPSVLYRNANFSGNQWDGSLRLGWKNRLGVSAMYRTSYGFAGILDLALFDKINVAYSYGTGSSNTVTAVSKGTHEIMIGIRLCRKSKTINEGTTAASSTEQEAVPELITTLNDTTTAATAPAPTATEAPVVVTKPKTPWRIDLDSLNRAFNVLDRMILFELNSSDKVLSNNQKTMLEQVTSILNEHQDLRVTVEGHTCDMGSEATNMRIAKGRAERIKTGLIKEGVPASRITIYPHGEQQPFVINSSEANRSKNRRVKFVFDWNE